MTREKLEYGGLVLSRWLGQTIEGCLPMYLAHRGALVLDFDQKLWLFEINWHVF